MTPLKPKKGSKTKWTSEKTKIKDYVQRKNKGIRKTSKKRWTFISSLSLGWGTKKVQIKINKNKKILAHQSPAKCCPLSCSCYVTLLFFFSPKNFKDKTKPQTSIQYLFLLSNTQNLTSVPKRQKNWSSAWVCKFVYTNRFSGVMGSSISSNVHFCQILSLGARFPLQCSKFQELLWASTKSWGLMIQC